MQCIAIVGLFAAIHSINCSHSEITYYTWSLPQKRKCDWLSKSLVPLSAEKRKLITNNNNDAFILFDGLRKLISGAVD